MIRTPLFGIAALALFAGVIPADAQSPGTRPSAQPNTPQGCREMVVSYRTSVLQEAQAAKKPVNRDTLKEGMVSRARDCAGQFNLNTLEREQLPELGVLYVIADNVAAAKQAFKRMINDTTFPADQRAMSTIMAMQAMRMTYVPDSGVAWAERYLPTIDSIPGVVDQKFIARAVLLDWYMNYDIDDKLMQATDAMLQFAKQMTPELQERHSSGIATAYGARASLYGSNLHADSAIALLKRAETDFPNLAATLKPQLASAIERYEMVGKKAPALHADYWVNDSASLASNNVTILVFTANWCPSCRNSYPTLTKINEELKPKGLRTVLAVSLDGVFEGVPMEPTQEVEANKKYFVEKHKFDYPIAIQRGDDGASSAAAPRNVQAFNVGAFPQFVVIDKQGVVRGVLMGWDPYGNRARALNSVLQQTL